MQMNALIPMMGQAPDVVGSLRQGNALAGETKALQRQNALDTLYRDQGAGILAGDQNALNALAGLDPVAALGVEQTHRGMAHEDKRMSILTAQEQRAAAEYAAKLSAEQRAAEAQQIEGAVKLGLSLPDAATWDAHMSKVAPDLVGQFGNRRALAQRFMSMAEVLKGFEPPAPLSPEGKLAADIAAGYVQPGQVSVDPKDVDSFRKEFSGLPIVKAFSEQSQAFSRIIASAKDPSAAGDLALIFNYMKILDPGSVVREGEFATAQNAAGVDERVRSWYNGIISGQRLTPDIRADFVNRAAGLYDAAEAQYQSIYDQYDHTRTSRGYGSDALIDFRYAGPRPQIQQPLQGQPATPASPPLVPPASKAPAIAPSAPAAQPAPAPAASAATPPQRFLDLPEVKEAVALGLDPAAIWANLDPAEQAKY